ncbi:MAG TPA: anti-sigma F factor antagonist [Clostridiales bacterium]|nr:anti-sigma F factor antagonist [Clostridiales bacterium]
MLQIKFSNRGNTLIVRLNGELDHHAADDVKRKIDNEMIKPACKNIVFDLSKLIFMDSSGIGVIMGRYKNIYKTNGKIMIVCSNPHIVKLLEMSGIPKIIPIFDNVDKAVKKALEVAEYDAK